MGLHLSSLPRCSRPSWDRGHHRIEGHTGHRCPMMRRLPGAELERPSDYETTAASVSRNSHRPRLARALKGQHGSGVST